MVEIAERLRPYAASPRVRSCSTTAPSVRPQPSRSCRRSAPYFSVILQGRARAADRWCPPLPSRSRSSLSAAGSIRSTPCEGRGLEGLAGESFVTTLVDALQRVPGCRTRSCAVRVLVGRCEDSACFRAWSSPSRTPLSASGYSFIIVVTFLAGEPVSGGPGLVRGRPDPARRDSRRMARPLLPGRVGRERRRADRRNHAVLLVVVGRRCSSGACCTWGPSPR